MKVGIYETVEVSDEQRVAIAARIDDAGSKPRKATRDEMKEFIWEQGAAWDHVLAGGASAEDLEGPDDDLTEYDLRDDEYGSEDLEDLVGAPAPADPLADLDAALSDADEDILGAAGEDLDGADLL